MKNNYALFSLLVIVCFLGLLRCGTPQFAVAPKGAVPTRDKLIQDVFGGYIALKTKDSVRISGELIGMRNDSVFVLSNSMNVVHRERISEARIIVHMPNNYKGAGLALMGISGLVIFHAAEFGSGPLALGIAGIAYNGIGLASAQGTEERKINYYEWWEGWQKVMLYSRFPHGVPSTVSVSELKPRTQQDNHTKKKSK